MKNLILKKRQMNLLLTLIFVLLLGTTAFARTSTVKMRQDGTKYTYSAAYKGEKYIYHKLRIRSSGVIRVTGYELSKNNKKRGFTIALCNSKKKRIDMYTGSSVSYVKGKIRYYTLEKGIYYIRVNGSSLAIGSKYIVQARLTSLRSELYSTGLSRDTAVYLNKNSSAFAFIPATAPGDGGRYVKFETDGEDPVELTFIPQLPKSIQGTFIAEIKGPSFPDGKELKISAGGDRYKLSTTVISKNGATTTKKTKGLKKGVYYVKVYREQTTPENMRFANNYIKITRG